ncbi:hypothetical protein [uncultured Methanobrevibacter sp.]|uniref:hypothetical protein n=1 Tax=uncultured Methanobrevibacter sp. TaxID=253161 RepID=UPI0025E15FC1|nr:hypothetical protein [uncultured Methanobrevibacter sp.]
MNRRNKLFIFGLILLVLFTVSSASASENVTDVVSDDDNLVDGLDVVVDGKKDVSVEYDAKLSAKDVNEQYDFYGNVIKVALKDSKGKLIKNQNVKVIWDGKLSENSYDEDGGKYYFDASVRGAGNHKVKIMLVDSSYSAKPIVINVKLTKAPVKMTAKKWISTTKSVTVLKVAVKDKQGYYVQDGVVKFKINGKTYKAKVNDGIAIKKIKLKKAKNYNYRATFVSKNYISKSVTSKVYVKKAKKYYKIKAGKYSIKLPYKKYLRLINAKNNNKNGYVSLKTGKFYYYDAPAYKTVQVKKTKWVYKKVLTYESFYYGDGTYDSYSYSLSKYYRAGWKWYGLYDKSFVDGYESYAKLKKKVTYTVSKQVRNGYKSAKSPIYVMVEILPKDGQIKKGDYIRAWTAGGGEMGTRLAFHKIDFYTYSP